MAEFVQFLRKLNPLLEGDMRRFQGGSCDMKEMVSTDPDFYSPFRQKAPLLVRAMGTIYSDINRLATVAGFFNIIAFRSTFYKSPWATESLQWFDSYDHWIQYLRASGKTGNEATNFFTYSRAYGQPTNHMHLDNLATYWAQRQKWLDHLHENSSRDVLELYRFFLNFTNVGSLTAMLIVGDLVECGFAPMPPVQKWAKLVADVNKGARMQLESLKLVSIGTSTPAQKRRQLVASAFVDIYNYANQELTPEERQQMGFNVIMVEHALCKKGRIATHLLRRNASRAKKSRRK